MPSGARDMMFRGLVLYTAFVIFHIKLCIRKPCSSSIIICDSIRIALHHHTNNNCTLTYIFQPYPKGVNVLMIGTGEYTTGYVNGQASDSDKGAGVVALTMLDLKSKGVTGRLGLCGVNGM